jgi:hypothetical protein
MQNDEALYVMVNDFWKGVLHIFSETILRHTFRDI